jgi:hypothetical protein
MTLLGRGLANTDWMDGNPAGPRRKRLQRRRLPRPYRLPAEQLTLSSGNAGTKEAIENQLEES